MLVIHTHRQAKHPPTHMPHLLQLTTSGHIDRNFTFGQLGTHPETNQQNGATAYGGGLLTFKPSQLVG